MTGVHRVDVRRLHTLKSAPKKSKNIIHSIIEQWQHNPQFTSKSGKPRVLSFQSGEGEFTELVHSVSVDLNPYTVLFELERGKSIERTHRGIKFTDPVFKPQGDVREKCHLMAQDTEHLLLAVNENIFEKPKKPNYHILTEYDNIVEDAVPEIREWFLVQGSMFHDRARKFLSRFDKDLNPSLKKKKGGVRAVLGGFSRVEVDTHDE